MSRTPSFAVLTIVAVALAACTDSTLPAQATAPATASGELFDTHPRLRPVP